MVRYALKRKSSYLLKHLIPLCPSFILYSCLLSCSLNAPRDNPLDPNLGGNVCGRVLSRNSYPIAYAEIAIPFADVVTRSDTSGNFSVFVLPEDTMWMFFSHESYSPESLMITPRKGVIDTLTVQLNGLPNFADCNVTTHHYERHWPPDPLYFCVLSCTPGDIDGEVDIESVWVEIPALSFVVELEYNTSERQFDYTLLVDDIPGSNLEVLVGKEIFYFAIDKHGAIVRSSPHYVTRILNNAPTIVFPKGGFDTLNTDTTFIWNKYISGYYVYYHGEIVRIVGGGAAGVAHSFDIFDQNDTTYNFSISLLNDGEYYWSLEVIDSLGNSARSKEHRFIRD